MGGYLPGHSGRIYRFVHGNKCIYKYVYTCREKERGVAKNYNIIKMC